MDRFGFENFDDPVQRREDDDIGGSFDTAQAIAIDGGIVIGEISEPSDVDYYRIDVTDGQTLRFGLFDEGLDTPGAPDTARIVLRNSNGEIVGSGLDTRNGLVTFNQSFDEDGTFFLEVSNGGRDSGVGEYNLIVENFIDDFANDITTEAVLVLGGDAIIGNLQSFGDTDVFAINAVQDQDIEITLTREGLTGLNSFTLLNSAGEEISRFDTRNGADTQVLSFTADATDTFFVNVRSTIFRATETQGLGEYSLTAEVTNEAAPDTPADDTDIAGDASTTATIEIGETVSSDLAPGGDSDWFAITIEAGQTVRFSATDSGFSRNLTLVDADGNVLAQGPSVPRAPVILQQDLIFTATETDTYFITITATTPPRVPVPVFGEGDYTITATEVIDDHGDSAQDATAILANGEATGGELGAFDDVDAFSLDLAAGQAFTIALNGTGAIDPLETFEILVFGPDGSQVARTIQANASGTLDFTSLEAGTHTIQVQGFVSTAAARDNSIGFYDIAVTQNTFPEPEPEPQITTIEGTDAPDVLRGTDGDDDIFGFDGEDRLIGSDGNDQLFGGNGDDSLNGNRGNDFLNGGDGDDILNAVLGHDVVLGGSGNDFISIGRGNHTIDGNAGIDAISVNLNFNDFQLTQNEDGTLYLTSNDLSDPLTATISNIENITFVTGIADTAVGPIAIRRNLSIEDFLTLTPDINIIQGNANLVSTNGNDLIFGIFDAFGSDFIEVFGGNDLVIAGDGDDVINIGDGEHVVDGGDGNDLAVLIGNQNEFTFAIDENDNLLATYNGADGLVETSVLRNFEQVQFLDSGPLDINGFIGGNNDTPDNINLIEGTDARDVLRGTDGDDDIFGFGDADSLSGGGGQDVLFGGAGNDSLSGGAGADSLFGEAGDDNLNGGDGNDFLTGGDGDDSLDGRNGEDDLFGDAGADIITGGNGQDFLNGGAGNDRLDGGADSDNLVGGSGDDRLTGERGNDLLTGGEGHDTFVFTQDGAVTQFGVQIFSSGYDRINDFTLGEDTIDLSNTFFNSFEELNIVNDNGTVFIYLDEDTSIEFTGIDDVDAFTADDFIF